MDEKGFLGEKHTFLVSLRASTHLNVLACCSGSGSFMPIHINFEGKVMKQELANCEVPGTMSMYTLSTSGWVDRITHTT